MCGKCVWHTQRKTESCWSENSVRCQHWYSNKGLPEGKGCWIVETSADIWPLLFVAYNLGECLFLHLYLCVEFRLSTFLSSNEDCCCCLVAKSHPTLLPSSWTVVCQAPLSMGFSWQFPSPGDLPAPGIEPESPACVSLIAGEFFSTEPARKSSRD